MVHAARALGLGVHARLHDRVGPRHRRRRARRAPLRPRRPRRQPPDRARPVAGRRVRRRRAGALRPARARCRTDATRYLILAEGFSARPALREDDARRDALPAATTSSRSSTRRGAGETRGRRADRRARSTTRSRFEPNTALVGVATQGGRFPPDWIALLRSCVAHGLDVENGLHVFLADDPELVRARGAARRRAARPARAAATTSRPRPARTWTCRRRSCSPSAPTARSGR